MIHVTSLVNMEFLFFWISTQTLCLFLRFPLPTPWPPFLFMEWMEFWWRHVEELEDVLHVILLAHTWCMFVFTYTLWIVDLKLSDKEQWPTDYCLEDALDTDRHNAGYFLVDCLVQTLQWWIIYYILRRQVNPPRGLQHHVRHCSVSLLVTGLCQTT